MYQWTRDLRGVVTTHCPRCPWTHRGDDRGVVIAQRAHSRECEARDV